MNTHEPFALLPQKGERSDDLKKWIFGIIKPYIKGRVLEINSGIDSFASLFIEHGISIHLHTIDKGTRDIFLEKTSGITFIRGIHNINFLHPDFKNRYGDRFNAFKTIIALNISIQGLPEQLLLENVKKFLKNKGCLILILPGFTALYNGLEISLEECKEYNRKSLRQFLGDCQILETKYFTQNESIETQSFNHLGFSVLVVARK